MFNYQALSLSLLFSAFFYGIDPFHLSSQICGHIAVHSIPFLSFYVRGVSSYCACLISHTRILCFSLFFLVSLARSLSVKNQIFTLLNLSIVSVCSLTGFCFNFHYFLSSALFRFILLFFLQPAMAETQIIDFTYFFSGAHSQGYEFPSQRSFCCVSHALSYVFVFI